jgi:hypothetical protein
MRARPRTLLTALALGGAVALVASACGTEDGPTGSSAAPTVTVTATVAAPTTTSPPGAPSVPATSDPRVAQGADAACSSSGLRVRYADDDGGAGAGGVNGTFTFVNTGDSACTLTGFPGVSYVTGDSGEQVGAAASRTGGTVTTATLEPAGRATASLRRSQPGNYGSDCRETDVRGFRVYPPGSRTAVFVAFATTGCRSTQAPLLQVGPVR